MKLQPPSLSHGGGPPTPPREKGAPREDHVEKYRRERLAFIAAIQRSSTSQKGLGEALLVKLTQDPEQEVALAAARAINHVLSVHRHVMDPVGTLRALIAAIESFEVKEVMDATEDGDRAVCSALLVQTEVHLALDVLWSTIDVDLIGKDVVRKLAEQFWETSRNCMERPQGEGETRDAAGSSWDGVRAAAVRAVAASCRRHGGDCLRAMQSILEAAKLSHDHMELQEHAFLLFSEMAASMPCETIDAAMLHAATWLREVCQRQDDMEKRQHKTSVQDTALTAVVSFVETTIALGSISEVIDGDLCALLCEYAEFRIDAEASESAVTTRSSVDGPIRGDHAGTCEASQSATVILQVLARLVNEREAFSLVVAKQNSLLEKICHSCLDDLEGPMLLPSLFLIGHVSKVSPDACRLISLGLREADGTDVASALVVSLAHTEKENIRQVAAWVLGVLGSSSSPAARHVASAGGLLTLMDATTRGNPDGTLVRTCCESCVAIISRLDCLETLIALLKLETAGDEEAREQDERVEGGETVEEANAVQHEAHARESHYRLVPHRAQEALFQRISQLLVSDLALRTAFVQQGALEALIALGERRPELETHMALVCNLYPQELVDRCSPKYMRKLIEQFKRESCCIPAASEIAHDEVALERAPSSLAEPSPPADVHEDHEEQGEDGEAQGEVGEEQDAAPVP